MTDALFESPPGVFRIMLKYGLILKLRNGREIYSLAFTTERIKWPEGVIPILEVKVKDILVTGAAGTGSRWLMADEDDQPITLPLDNVAGWQWVPAKPDDTTIRES